MRGLSTSYRVLSPNSEPEESPEKKTENGFYELAKSGLATPKHSEKNRKKAELNMLTYPNLRIYHHWFIPINDIKTIISKRMELKEIFLQIKEDVGKDTIYTQQIDALLNRVHPELDELFNGDQETKLKAQNFIFGEYDYSYVLTEAIFSNLKRYMCAYHSETYEQLILECKKYKDDLDTPILDYLREQVNETIRSNVLSKRKQ